MSERIVSNPKIMMGKPVVRGTRITVELVLEKLAAGESIEKILDAHPRLSRDVIQACLPFAAGPSGKRPTVEYGRGERI